MFQVNFSKQAIKFLKNSNKELVSRLFSKIETLKKEPIGHDSKSVEGFKEKLFRVRVGDYRILYEVDHNNNLIGIVKIDKRERVY
ncbi:MAG: type II toxin-antitoxin system RelE family toxin [Nanoarchaeota archaeon]